MSYNVSRSSGLAKTVEAVITDADLTAAATTQTIEAISLPAAAIVTQVAFYLDEEFDGGATSELTIEVGDGDDPNGYITAQSVHADATTVTTGIVDGVYLTVGTDVNTGNSKQYAAAGTIKVLFTATGANVSVLTAGKLRVIVSYLDIA